MKNDYEIRGDVTAIFMYRKSAGCFEALISTDDLDKVKELPNTWYPHWNNCTNSFYARVQSNGKQISLHRFLLDFPERLVVDHINHNTLDNRRENLRMVLHQQNLQNRSGAQSNSTSGIRGVSFNKEKGKWSAQIYVKRKKLFLGYFHDKFEAESSAIQARRIYMPYSTN